MTNKFKFGEFYTKRAKYIIGNLLQDLDPDLVVVEPFCGEGDLLITNHKFELYDINPKISGCESRDCLINPPDYSNRLVVTNPPFLAKNKNPDKTVYNKWGVTDYYKAAIKSIMGCQGGIIILPLNFLCDENSEIRTLFFSRFKITRLNVFEEAVFNDTTYSVISFSFKVKTLRENLKESEIIETMFFPSGENSQFELKLRNGYKIGSDFLDIIDNQENIGIQRLTENSKPNSNLFLRATDSGGDRGRISLTINHNNTTHTKQSARTFANIILDKEYSLNQQIIICEKFNEFIEFYRKKYHSMFLTTYRNSTTYSRKRISFNTAYKIISYVITKWI